MAKNTIDLKIFVPTFLAILCLTRVFQPQTLLEETDAVTTQRKKQLFMRRNQISKSNGEVPSFDHGRLVRSLRNSVIRFDRTIQFLIWLFLIFFNQINDKLFGNSVKSTTAFCAICWSVIELTLEDCRRFFRFSILKIFKDFFND